MSLPQHEQIDIRPARSVADYLFLRTLRNRVRGNMTNDTGLITYMAQLRFYLRKPANIDIYVACRGTKRIGYLLLRHDGPTTLISEAVEESHRGAGVGTRMVRYAQRLHADLTAEIRADNVASIKMVRGAGFAFISARGDLQTFRWRPGNEPAD